MSLRGVISTIAADKQTSFDEAMYKMKQALTDVTGIDLHNATDSGNSISVEGIIQGDIKLQAINDWKTTMFYGFSDAAQNVGFGGTNASAIIKFANTVGNVLGYTLGGTGPASKKMYGGSNLNGFTVQFKWYTPYMQGWKSAIQALTFIAWPSSPFDGDGAEKLVNKQNTPQVTAASQEEQYKSILKKLDDHAKAILHLQSMVGAAIRSGLTDDQKATELRKVGSTSFGFTDLNEIASYIARYATDADACASKTMNLTNMSTAIDANVKNAAIARSELQLYPNDIGSDINTVHWYDQSGIPVNPSAIKIDGMGDKQSPEKKDTGSGTSSFESAYKGVHLLNAGVNIASGTLDLLKGLANSIAVNPPKVQLEIFSGTEIKYRFSPLVVTSFTMNASRETINGDPVIVTIDVSFDYYAINSTGSDAADKANQLFAGVPIFRVGV